MKSFGIEFTITFLYRNPSVYHKNLDVLACCLQILPLFTPPLHYAKKRTFLKTGIACQGEPLSEKWIFYYW